jgi:predicted HicB family RNase H-like nuclease
VEILKYKEFEGSAELDMARSVCRGKILYIDDLVTYESKTIEDLQNQFQEAVDDYIETCVLVGKEPQKPCRGQFNVRVSSTTHRAALRRATADDTTLNDVVCKALEAYLSGSMDANSPAHIVFASSFASELNIVREKSPRRSTNAEILSSGYSAASTTTTLHVPEDHRVDNNIATYAH